MKRIVEYHKEISALKLKIDALKEISVEYPSTKLFEIISDNEKRLRKIKGARAKLITEYQARIKNPLLQKIFQMRYIDRLNFKEIAKRLNYSESRIFKLHRKLIDG